MPDIRDVATQRAIADAYITNGGNQEQAVIAAGYSMISGNIPLHFRRRLRITAISGWIILQPGRRCVLKRVACTGS